MTQDDPKICHTCKISTLIDVAQRVYVLEAELLVQVVAKSLLPK